MQDCVVKAAADFRHLAVAVRTARHFIGLTKLLHSNPYPLNSRSIHRADIGHLHKPGRRWSYIESTLSASRNALDEAVYYRERAIERSAEKLPVDFR